MPKNNQILQIEPPEALTFTGPFTEVVKSTLMLTNPSDTKVAFKIKTTAPKRYCVRPNSGSLQKDESMSISVMLQPFEFDPYEKTKHKFMIQSLIVNPDMEDKDVWLDVDKDKLMDTKLRVVFDNETVSPVNEVPQEEETPINNLDMASEPVQMTPQKANLAPSPATKVTASGDDDYSRVVDENKRLSKEMETLREEANRLKKLALTETKSLGTPVTPTSGATVPQGIGLLFHDTTNIILLLVLFLTAFAAGLFLSNSILGA